MSPGFSFQHWLDTWALTPDGDAIATHSSWLLPVLTADNTPAVLKCPQEKYERLGGLLMRWWHGEGAARVLAYDKVATDGSSGGTLLLERLNPTPLLLHMAHGTPAEDEEAVRLLCEGAAALHAPRNTPLPKGLVRLEQWFEGLWPEAERHGGVLGKAADAARHLLATQTDFVTLHGDLHHSNLLLSARGWLAIDPKPLIGERGFDFGNILCNPDVALNDDPAGRMARQFNIVAAHVPVPRERLRLWILAYAGLSAAWSTAEDDGETARHPLLMAEILAQMSV